MTNNQLSENSVNQLLNSVRLARDNAERADNRIDHSFYHALTIALEELQERRKAATKTITLPTPACTYADHSYPAYTKQQILTMLESLGVTVVEEDV